MTAVRRMRQTGTDDAEPSWGVPSVLVRGHDRLTEQAGHTLTNSARAYARYRDMSKP